MPKPSEAVEMSSVVPKWVRRALRCGPRRRLRERLPLRWADALNQFLTQTRLLFSRAILLLLAALFVGFSWLTIAENIHRTEEIFVILTVQTVFLAIILNMGLWELEREGRTLELLMMRIPGTHRLLWFKLRVSWAWMFALSLPFFAAYGWFLGISPLRMGVYYVFCMMTAALTSLLTCVVASFVPHGLTAGIIAMVLTFMAMGLTGGPSGGGYRFSYVKIFLDPFNDGIEQMGLTPWQSARLYLANRALVMALCLGLYAWLAGRVGRTEKWIA